MRYLTTGEVLELHRRLIQEHGGKAWLRDIGSLESAVPTPLFPLPEGVVAFGTRTYELHPDGRRFLVGVEVKTDPPPPITRLHLVHNWFAELERLAPTGR